MDKRELIHIREAVTEDYNFIMATWLRGLYYGNDWFKRIDKEAFMHHYWGFINKLLTKPTTRIRVACLNDDPQIVLGYSVSEAPVLHWIFVKKAWRKIGLARDLTPKETTTITHITNVFDERRHHYKFDPFSV